MLLKVILLVVSTIYFTHAATLLWSNHELNISPLEEFETQDFLNVVNKLQKPEVYIFKSSKPISSNLKPLLKGYYSMYNPNGDIESKHYINLTGNSEMDLQIIESTINTSTNFISTIIFSNNFPSRLKRGIETTDDDSDIDEDTEIGRASPKGPVVYKSSKTTNTNKKIFALMYSSQPLLFKRNDSEPSEVYLGNVDDDMIIFDTRLNVNIPNGKSKITLRFNFTWQNGYWYMPSVKITDTQSKTDYNLVTKEDVGAAAHFSYHCNGKTKFVDSAGVELIIYDLQVQIDSDNGKFGDANDCVPFTTAPIWSGIFITALLGIGMTIALLAIMDIKTMDKFDNYKTKNLAITVAE